MDRLSFRKNAKTDSESVAGASLARFTFQTEALSFYTNIHSGCVLKGEREGFILKRDRWMWDIYGTGFPKPNEPVWMSDFVRETCTREEPVPAVYLPPSKYDEMKTYFKDLDRHMGITRERPSKISMWAWWGEVDVIRTEEP